MNLAEALNAALPPLPTQQAGKSFPRFNPAIIARQHMEEGAPIVIANVPKTSALYRFSPEQWALIQLFDGQHDYEEIARLFTVQSGIQFDAADVREFAHQLDETDFWLKSPLEKNIALKQKLAEQRHQHEKKHSRFGDVSHIQFSAWDPDEFFTRIYPRLKFVYRPWFTALTLVLFAFMLYIFFDRWSEISADTLTYYNFTEKSFADLAEFWLLFLVLAFFHESSHGLTCKHYGGAVHRMGFHLVFLTPAFFVDVTEAWVYAERWQRLATIIAGIWVELIFCAVATVVWWGTAAGTFLHEFSYKVMLITGIAVVVVNVNPLIKLDGYYAFTELIGISDIKEKSTSYVSSWVKRHIWRLPVEVDYVPPRRRPLYISYALLSGAYSYMLLFLVARFCRNVFYAWTPEWAFVPALFVAWLIFKSRIRTLVRSMKTLYLDKKERLRAWFTPPRLAAVSAALLLFLLVPWKFETVEGRFVLEPAQRAVLRAEVPGSVASMRVREGQRVEAGETIAVLQNLDLESAASQKHADAQVAQARATQAALQYVGFGPADRERQQTREQEKMLLEQVGKLRITAPIAGTVVTARPQDLEGAYVAAGTELAEIADLRSMQAQIFVPENEVARIPANAEANVRFDGLLLGRGGNVASVAPASSEVAPGLMPHLEYKGMLEPHYYAVKVVVTNADGSLRQGMSGTARIYVRRRSLLGFLVQDLLEFLGRKFW